MKKTIVFTIIPLILLNGCRVGVPYVPPCIEVPGEWKAPHLSDEESPCVDNWWEIFNDETLNNLEQFAIQNNPNLYVALQHIVESRAAAGVSASNLYPQLNLNPSYSNTGRLFQLQGVSAIPFPTPIPTIIRIHQMEYNLPLNLSYEIDLWGKLRSQYESALYHVDSQIEDYLNTLLTLTTELASNYFLLRSFDAQIQYLESNIEVNLRNQRISQSRFDKGLSTYLDVAEADQVIAQVEAELYDVQRQRALQENAIATLLGVPASGFSLESSPLIEQPPTIPAGLPSSILLRRPDLAMLESETKAQHELINSAYASFLPSISLTGILGFSSPELKDFLKWKSRFWSYGTNIGQTVFDGGRKISDLEITYAQFNEASGSYQQQVLVAFQEVEDALAGIEWQFKQANSLKASYEASGKALALSNRRYTQGVANYLEVVVNHQTELTAHRSYINVVGQQYLSTVQLIKALGGAWD